MHLFLLAFGLMLHLISQSMCKGTVGHTRIRGGIADPFVAEFHRMQGCISVSLQTNLVRAVQVTLNGC